MSNDMISVPRELLERLERIYMDGMSIYGECEEIRALLAQRCTCPSGDGSLRWPCPVHPPADPGWLWGKLMEWCRNRRVSPAGYSDLFELCGMQQGSRECPPEPVGWQFLQDGKWWNGDDRIKDHRLSTEAAGYPTRNVFASQPAAQAPVVLPPLPPAQLPDFDDGWESYEAEFKHLNPGITEAAPLRKS